MIASAVQNHFGIKVLPTSQVRCVTYVSRLDLKKLVPAVGLEPTT